MKKNECYHKHQTSLFHLQENIGNKELKNQQNISQIDFNLVKNLDSFNKKKTKNETKFLYYIIPQGLTPIFHIKNIETNLSYIIELYNNTQNLAVEFFQGYIFFCGGKGKNLKFLNTCATMSLKKKELKLSYFLNEVKSYVSLISTKSAIYCVGGFNGSSLRTCEFFNFIQKAWVKTYHLNIPSCCITLGNIENEAIYCFGGSLNNTVEKLQINRINNSWKILQINQLHARRYGSTYSILKTQETLIFGGEYTFSDSFVIFNHKKLKYDFLNKYFRFKVSFDSSRPVLSGMNIHIIGSLNSKAKFNQFLINLITLETEVKEVDF